MKIDIHTHTKKCKLGDAPTREISATDFCETILSTEVRIIAITNHNVFDLEQYNEIKNGLPPDTQVWPGIELDIREDGSRGHLLVIVSPNVAEQFSQAVDLITKNTTPDNFEASIDNVLEAFDSLKPLYVAHYKQKTPNIADDVLERLTDKTANSSQVIKEVSNSISAGIYISHGHASIFGSDVQDWSDYETIARDLPDLRLPVESFEHFCLLLEKDPTTINTVLDKKISETLNLCPFGDGTFLNMKVFNDINIVFGPKGTGKSCILKAIEKHYLENGKVAKLFESASDKLGDLFDTKGKDLTINLNTYGINYCTNEIEALRATNEVGVTSLNKYVAYFDSESTNRNANKILLKDIEPEEERTTRHSFDEFNEATGTTSDFIKFLENNPAVKKELTKEEHLEVTRILSELLNRLNTRKQLGFSAWKETCLLNSAIQTFRSEVERKTGTAAKPTTTGFRDYAINRMMVESNAAKIIKSIETQLSTHTQDVGSLGPNKGELECRTEYMFHNGTVSDSSLLSLSGVKKTVQKNFVNQVRRILVNVYTDELFPMIAELNDIDDVQDVKSVHELLLFKRYFSLGNSPYTPSSGEASMVMLQEELEADKEIYILDEPERSLGNEYINDVIVPLLKSHARTGKKVFISTHDANIAVRTLPYSSIYRYHGSDGYRTYIGNPHPDFTSGFIANVGYKGFDLLASFYASVGNDILNLNRRTLDFNLFQRNRSTRRLYESWGSPYLENNEDATMPIAELNDVGSQQPSSYYVEDGSYLRLQTLQLGYSLPKHLINRINLSKVRIYVMASNVFTITGYSGLDPAIMTSDRSFGLDLGLWPTPKMYHIGLNVSF